MGIHIHLDEMMPVVEGVLRQEGQVRWKPAGSSMEPLIRNRKDVITVEKKRTPKLGDIIFYKRLDGKYIVHRIVEIDDIGRYYVCGDHQRQVEFPVYSNQVIGVVTEIERGNRKISVYGNWNYRIYSFYCRKRASFYRIFGHIKSALKSWWMDKNDNFRT